MNTTLALVPAQAATDQAKYKAVIEVAAKVRDWQTLLIAVEDMIAHQRDVVAWWDANVTPGQSPGSNQWSVADLQPTIAADDATRLTGIQKWQITRWRNALDKEATYQASIIEAAQRKAGLRDDDPMRARGQPDRDGPDFWPTPDSLIQAAAAHMIPVLPDAAIWECACGDGRLGRGIAAEIMTDKYPQDSSIPLDFLTDDPPADDLIAFTNQPFNAAAEFLARGLELFDAGAIRGLVLLLRHDHFMAGGKVEALNRAVFEVHCNWRPTWIPDTEGNPRWAFAWVYWGAEGRRAPLYLQDGQ